VTIKAFMEDETGEPVKEGKEIQESNPRITTAIINLFVFCLSIFFLFITEAPSLKA